MSTRVHTKRYRALVLTVLAGAALWAIGSFALADTGTNTPNIQPGSSLPNGGAVDVTMTSSSISRPNGNATIQAGVLIGRVVLAEGYGPRLKVDVAWLDPNDADQVLNNPNAQIYAALYHPIAQGNAACGAQQPNVGQLLIDVTDAGIPGLTGSSTFCAHVDAAATGSVMTGGNLMLTQTNIAGYIKEAADDSAAPTCTGTVPGSDVWCHPTGLNASHNVLWIALTIVTPGGKPAGQQNNLNSLSFYTQVKAL